MERVLSRTSKVVLDVEDGNNLMMLPLDQMAKGGARAMADNRSDGDSEQVPYDMQELTDQVVEQLRQRESNSSRRGR